ncbi:MAG TPA: PIN domain-containing protein [Gemmatimonadaceae bacterium]|nr:PIN domain-containing protein [Gemmatimonadaceae bacterium]
MTVVADTGAVYALIDASDAWHARVKAWWRQATGPIVLPAPILPEVTWLLQTRIGVDAEQAFVNAVVDGEFTVEPVDAEDLARVAALMADYADLPLGYVDACVAAVAERLGTRQVLTTDRRHFAVVRGKRRMSLALLP